MQFRDSLNLEFISKLINDTYPKTYGIFSKAWTALVTTNKHRNSKLTLADLFSQLRISCNNNLMTKLDHFALLHV